MVGAEQHAGFGCRGDLDAGVESAVAPALLSGVFGLGVRAIGNQHVHAVDGALNGLGLLVHKALVLCVFVVGGLVNVVRRLMVAREKNRLSVALNAITRSNS